MLSCEQVAGAGIIPASAVLITTHHPAAPRIKPKGETTQVCQVGSLINLINSRGCIKAPAPVDEFGSSRIVWLLQGWGEPAV